MKEFLGFRPREKSVIGFMKDFSGFNRHGKVHHQVYEGLFGLQSP
jgi:hypothetical protein